MALASSDLIVVKLDDLRDGNIVRLLEEHRREMFKHSPPESVHALDLEGMRAKELTFWSAWFQGEFAGCGALKELDANHGELKSMKTHLDHLRKGVAAKLLETMLDAARRRGYQRVSLETGSMAAFEAARLLYFKNGFTECPPFSNYFEDPNSVCMTLSI